jgi:hypothetical protein
MDRKFSALCSFALALTLSGCAAEGDGPGCYPENARKWMTAAKEPTSQSADPGGPYTVYLDGSGSMGGYIRGATSVERPLADLIGMLPGLRSIDRSEASVVRFDEEFTDLTREEANAMQSAAAYGSKDSHIDQVLGRIASADGESLSVVVSDLWLVNSGINTGVGVALSEQFADIFANGRSVAIYGFEVPYSGRVSDLPSGSRNVSASKRYLFLLVAGPVARVDAFHQAMQSASSTSIGRYMADDTAKYALFTTEPARDVEGTQSFALAPRSALTVRQFLPVRNSVRVPQYRFDKSAALVGASSMPGARWAGVPRSAIRVGATMEGSKRGETKIYREIGDGCAANAADWANDGSLRGGWEADGSFTLEPGELTRLTTGRYLLVGSQIWTDVSLDNPATQWMRDWSFNATNEAEAITRPVMPTLDLAVVARILELELQRAVRAKPVKLGGFAVAVEVK